MKIDAVKLFAICADNGISMKALKEKTGLSYNTICAIRQGQKVKAETLGKIAKALGVKSIELIAKDQGDEK